MTACARAAWMIVAAYLVAGCASAPASTTASAPRGASDAERAAVKRFAEALTLMKNQQADAALQAFVALAHDYPQFSGPLTNAGILCAQKKDYASATASFQKAVSINPRNAIAWTWLGTMQRNAGDFERARQSYSSAIAAEPNFAPAHYNLAILYDVCLKRRADALPEYRAYRALEPDKLIVEAWIRELDGAAASTAVAQRGTQ